MATKETDSKQEKLLVAAIDFGTSFSGLAYSFRSDYDKYRLKIHAHQLSGTTSAMSVKSPTTVLLDNKEQFVAFGYEAEEEYSSKSDENIHNGYHYFKNFKMVLYNNEDLKRNTLLSDDQGHSIPAIRVFTECIKHFKGLLLKTLEEKGNLVREEEITWVITIPAIWNDQAQQFMRESAKEAGIENSNIILALEPEAASLYVKELHLTRTSGDCQTTLTTYSPGTKYMIVDLGGGTVDITAREVLEDGALKELCKASGSASGGTTVNQEIYRFFNEVFGEDVMIEFEQNNRSESLDLQREVETKKRKSDWSQDCRILFKVPGTLQEVYKERRGKPLTNAIAFDSKYSGKIDLRRQNFKVDKGIIEECFQPALEYIVKHVSQLLSMKELSGITDILLVGGFSESGLVINTMKKKFSNLRVFSPEDAGLAVLKGAVLYGHNPGAISHRVCKYTYGIEGHRFFIEGSDPEEKKFVIKGRQYCKEVFESLVEMGDLLPVGKCVETEISPLSEDMTKMSINIYKSTEKIKPKHITDKGCKHIGKITVDMPNLQGGLNRNVKVSLTFGSTEICVRAHDETSKNDADIRLNLLD